jgi:hypothetical protein
VCWEDVVEEWVDVEWERPRRGSCEESSTSSRPGRGDGDRFCWVVAGRGWTGRAVEGMSSSVEVSEGSCFPGSVSESFLES